MPAIEGSLEKKTHFLFFPTLIGAFFSFILKKPQ